LLHELDRTEFILHPKSQSSPTPLHILNEPHNDETVPQGDIVWSGYSGPHFGWQNDADYTPGWNGKRLSDMLKDGDYQIPSIARQPYARMRNTSSWQYVIDAKETIWVHSYYHHPDLVNGERVYGAGEMFIDCSTGEIVWINDASNSYRPDGLEFYPYLDRQLHKLGIRVSKTWQRTYVGLEG
ncbi:MAG TPA: hypothetical protein PKH77_12950, partial [Anaerolineae bacterium]|nr:hypothetical protein [Anaerolineae bacterium]